MAIDTNETNSRRKKALKLARGFIALACLMSLFFFGLLGLLDQGQHSFLREAEVTILRQTDRAGLQGGQLESTANHFPASATMGVKTSLPLDLRTGPSDFNTEAYDRIVDNPFLDARQNPLSTFSIDVDTASYSNIRRFLKRGTLPPEDAVRIEELVNYFSYNYTPPTGEEVFSTHVEVAQAPWSPDHRLASYGHALNNTIQDTLIADKVDRYLTNQIEDRLGKG